VFDIGLLDIVELFLVGLIGLVAVDVEEVFVLFVEFHDVEGHLQTAVLKFDYKVDEDFVLDLSDIELFSDLPELLCHPIRNDGDILQVVHIGSDVLNLISK